MSVVDKSTEENIETTEEALDLQAVEAKKRRAHKCEEFQHLRERGSYEVWTRADAAAYRKANPEAKTLTSRWVETDAKARLVVREYNNSRTSEYFAATGNPLGHR
eukprot:1652158-Lingulodinium_polyedra.AAC.1